jgi:hypothetical protein
MNRDCLTFQSLVGTIYTTYFNNQQFCVLPTKCICRFFNILSVNSDYFLKQHQPVYLCNGEELCFLCGTDWILKYYLDELRLQRANNSVRFRTFWNLLSVLLHWTCKSEMSECISHIGRSCQMHFKWLITCRFILFYIGALRQQKSY